jgi:methyl-accepting chemotaxis protein
MFKQMSLAAKLIGGFVFVAVLCAVVAVVGTSKLQQIVVADTMLYRNMTLPLGEMGEVSTVFQRLRMATVDYVDAKTKEKREGFKKIAEEYRKSIEMNLVSFEKSIIVDKERGTLRELKENLKAYTAAQDKIYAYVNAEDFLHSDKLYTEIEANIVPKIQKNLDLLWKGKIDSAKKTAEGNAAQAGSGIMMMIVTAGICVLSSLALGILLSWTISASLNRTVASLSVEATHVTEVATQLSSSSQGLAEGSSQQAASLEETSSAMEEMSAMTKRNAESAGQAKSLADQAGASVQKSNASMQSLVTSMAEISRMGEETGKIIKTIDEIAFQTNLLALNAAVEAARAGEAGAGFAVVADEVRNLAQRAAGAAKNTSELIEGTIKKIKDGTVLVEKTNVAFGEVASAVTKVTELVGEISAASSEQSRGIDEVSGSIGQMDKVTQGNAANAEEIASASEEMSAQSQALEGIVRSLHSLVKGGGAEEHAAPVSHAAPPTRRKVALPAQGAKPPAGRTARASIGGGKSAGENGRYHGGNGKSHPSQNPEDLIPFEENTMAEF